MSLGTDLAGIYGRELERLATEVEAYGSDADLWSTIGAQKNSAGTLALHTIGGLLSMVGAGLGGTGYVRDREREFSERGVSRTEVAGRVREGKAVVVRVLEGISDADMGRPYPGPAPPQFAGMTTQAFLIHLLWHVGWHVGQVYYLRLGLMGAPGRT